jgi:hypothetical protein
VHEPKATFIKHVRFFLGFFRVDPSHELYNIEVTLSSKDGPSLKTNVFYERCLKFVRDKIFDASESLICYAMKFCNDLKGFSNASYAFKTTNNVFQSSTSNGKIYYCNIIHLRIHLKNLDT